MSVPFQQEQFNPVFPRKKIPLNEVYSSQYYTAPDKVERMRKTWSRSMDEPIVALRNGRYVVLDGHHRVDAAIERGHKWLRARISE